eukprot:CAMPEP_0171919416 /NCGR_PEP_ID=MMETSP0993-20121228/18119_1 /TAXON_ID=483369 /ORGANISM="non described non described, Strain CCMP2098" /LENGTH=78 /DNA_ID=CAMNT_0012556067 /DNA_START=27 /DNA_END=260 /DNA_ORIENTATION=+
MTLCEVSSNTAEHAGGGLYGDTITTFTMTSCVVSSNAANTGGGFYITGSSVVTMTSCEVTSNTATNDNLFGQGGGFYI